MRRLPVTVLLIQVLAGPPTCGALRRHRASYLLAHIRGGGGGARATVVIVCDRDEVAPARSASVWLRLDHQPRRGRASDVEAVTIATPDHLHLQPTLAMLRAGKHVLVEKPLATTVADGRAMVEAAESAAASS